MTRKKNYSTSLLTILLISIVVPITAQPLDTTNTETLSTTATTPVQSIETTPTVTSQETTTSSQAATSAPSTSQPDLGTTSTISDDPTSVTLPDGVIYQVLKEGTGPEVSTTATRLIHYTLYLESGKKIESSRDKDLPVPFEFTPETRQAIPGMDAGTSKMRIGEVRKLYVPADQAYGSSPHGNVPANSNLIFNIELVDTKDTPSDSAESM